jgi:hypothetical protein
VIVLSSLDIFYPFRSCRFIVAFYIGCFSFRPVHLSSLKSCTVDPWDGGVWRVVPLAGYAAMLLSPLILRIPLQLSSPYSFSEMESLARSTGSCS